MKNVKIFLNKVKIGSFLHNQLKGEASIIIFNT
jgi:hypothetical protein